MVGYDDLTDMRKTDAFTDKLKWKSQLNGQQQQKYEPAIKNVALC